MIIFPYTDTKIDCIEILGATKDFVGKDKNGANVTLSIFHTTTSATGAGKNLIRRTLLDSMI